MGGTTVELGAADIVASARLHNLRALIGARMMARTAVVMALVVVVLIALVVFARLPVWLALVGVPFYALVLAAVFLLIHALVVPRQARRVFAQQRSLHGPIAYRWSDEGFGVETPTSRSLTPWSHYVKWAEDGRSLLLYHSAILHQLLPKRALTPADLAAIRGHLVAARVPTAGWFR